MSPQVTRARLGHLDGLIRLYDEALVTVQSGDILDGERFAKDTTALVDALRISGAPTRGETERWRRLAAAHTDLLAAVHEAHANLRNNLVGLDRGRRGVAGYGRAAAAVRPRGANFGRG